MRHNATDAEALLWSKLRDRQLNGFKFRRQVPVQGFIVDFLCLQKMLAVELDGGQHTDPGQIRYDEQRTQKLFGSGFRELRFSNIDVLRDIDMVLTEILREAERRPVPSPGTPAEG
jgi:adenine-specific DNA-methyltransferase